MRSRLSSVLFVSVLAVAPFFHAGCEPRTALPFTAEVDDPDYRRGKELLRMGREQEGLAQFLRVIDQRGGAAAESHLEAGILYQNQIKDQLAAIYHYRRYREMRPNSEQSKLVLQSIEACMREFARTLPAQPMDNQVDRTDLMDAIDRLQRENLQIKEQLAAARAAVLETTRQNTAANGPNGGAETGFALTSPPVEPSQGGLDMGMLADPHTEYSVPVGVVPVPAPPTPSVALRPSQSNSRPAPSARPSATPPAAAPASAAGVRRHVVSKGDTLMSISLRYYGNRSRWREILAANHDVLPSETGLKIGMELKIPQ